MIEYLYNTIRVAGQGIETIVAQVGDNDGNPITEGVKLMIHNDDEMLFSVDGEYVDGIWHFPVSTKGLTGRYWYCICHQDAQLCFKQPIYFMK